ncbi:MAG: IMP dehydrogenase, partial [Verrucomicrobiota bacterium]|nr:IMP dehydrogenase [Verrucomicrobiota bacterium]
MAAEQKNPDSRFYLSADDFFLHHADTGLTFDDVTLATLYSDLLPRETVLDTTLAKGINLHLPIISADMDTVTEHRMAIAMALNGGLGLVHYNMTEKQQLKEVSRVKNHVHGLIQEPITVTPDLSVGDVLTIIEERRYSFSTFPIVDNHGQL